MAKKKKKQTKKQNKKIKKDIKDAMLLTVIICAIVVALYSVISLVSSPTDTFILQKSKISSEISKVGYVIRDEHVIDSIDEFKTIEPIKTEGERVSAKNAIFKYYNVDQEEITKQIDDLNLEIQQALLGQTDLFSSDIKSLDTQIEDQLENVKEQNNMQNIKEYKNNLSNYIVKKAKIAGSLSAAGEYINDLISQRTDLEQTLSSGSEYIYSEYSGIVSYRIDDLEEYLTVDKIDDLTIKYLEDLDLTTGQIISKSNNKVKVVNNFECYIAVPFGKDVLEKTSEGKSVYLRLASQDEIKADVYKIINDGSKTIIVFKITDKVEKLINTRKIALDVIWWKYDGLMIPKSTILYENGLSYIIRKKSGSYEKILIKILKQNDNYCIIDNYDTEELQELGFNSDEIDEFKKIKMYDEIMTDPEIK